MSQPESVNPSYPLPWVFIALVPRKIKDACIHFLFPVDEVTMRTKFHCRNLPFTFWVSLLNTSRPMFGYCRWGTRSQVCSFLFLRTYASHDNGNPSVNLRVKCISRRHLQLAKRVLRAWHARANNDPRRWRPSTHWQEPESPAWCRER